MQQNPVSPSRTAMPVRRLCNIVTRTAHIAVTGILVGGHVFRVDPKLLIPYLYLAVTTGVVLMLIEAFPYQHYWFEGRGTLVVVKVLLLCSVLWLWNARVPILLAVVVIGSFGSHMPRKYRHYALTERRFVDPGK